MYFPPRRAEDYAHMRYIKTEEEVEEDNYMIEETREFIFQKYKTRKRYGKQRFEIPEKLYGLIRRYIKKNKIEYGERLIQYNGHSDKYNDRSLRNKLKEIFGASVDGIRHAYVTNLYRNPENLYNIKEISMMMSHSVGEHIMYLDKENKPIKDEEKMNIIMIDEETKEKMREIGMKMIIIKEDVRKDEIRREGGIEIMITA